MEAGLAVVVVGGGGGRRDVVIGGRGFDLEMGGRGRRRRGTFEDGAEEFAAGG